MFPKYHYTSSLIYRFMKQYGVSDEVLDIGSGSGILAFKAREINPECRVVCSDIDPEAVRASKEMNPEADVYLSNLMENIPQRPYKTILANLNPNELDKLLKMKHEPGCLIYCTVFKEISDIYIEDLGYKIIDSTSGYEFNAYVLECK